MHFYAFHLAEYAAHTRHLTPMEDLALRRLLDAYYLAERAPQGTVDQVARQIGLRGELEAVASVLGEFFRATPEGWINARAERELTTYRERRESAAAAGRASADKRRVSTQRKANDRSTVVQRSFNGRSTTVQPDSNGRSTGVQRPFNDKDNDNDNYKDNDKEKREDARAPANPEPPPRSAPADAGRVSHSPPVDASVALVKAPQSDDRPEPAPRGRSKQIAPPAPSQSTSEPSAIGALDERPTVEQVIDAWAAAGLPRPTRPSVELIIDRAVRLRPERDLAWCRQLFERVARSPWCRGEVHGHPGCEAWSLAHTLGHEKRIASVLSGKYDPEPERERNKPALRNDAQHETDHRFTEVPAKEAEARRAEQARAAATRARWTSADGWDEPPIEPMMIEEADEDEGYMIALTGKMH